jgi:ribosomal protein S18 acetylase RimI-like enzyme
MTEGQADRIRGTASGNSKIPGSSRIDDIEIREVRGDDEARACATIMSTSEPWITLKRDFDASLAVVSDPNRETYVAADDSGVVGLVVLNMRGGFVGYIQSIAVRPDCRGSGLGTRLMAFAEERILRETTNVFICVSSFNPRARALYERLGYKVIGELKDFIVAGHSEFLMRKTSGPLVLEERRTG